MCSWFIVYKMQHIASLILDAPLIPDFMQSQRYEPRPRLLIEEVLYVVNNNCVYVCWAEDKTKCFLM